MRLKVRGKLYDTTKKEVEKKLFNVEPEIGRKYFVEIRGSYYPIKQVVGEAFSLPRAEFITQEAYRILRNLGFKIIER